MDILFFVTTWQTSVELAASDKMFPLDNYTATSIAYPTFKYPLQMHLAYPYYIVCIPRSNKTCIFERVPFSPSIQV